MVTLCSGTRARGVQYERTRTHTHTLGSLKHARVLVFNEDFQFVFALS